MMRVRLACPCLLALATVAEAAPPELALGDLQLELEPRRDLLADDSTDPYVRFAGFAQLTGGGQGGGDVGAGASAAIAGLGCDVVSGRVQGRLRFDSSYAGEAQYDLCLLRTFFTIDFSGRRGVGLEPSLDARRSLWARHYDETYDRAELGFGEAWKDDASNRHTIFLMALGHGETRQAERTVVTIDFDFTLYRYHHVGDHQLVVDAIVLSQEALKAGTDNKGGIGTAFLPVRMRYESPTEYVRAQAGWGFSGGSVTASTETKVNGETTSMWSDTIDSSGLPDMTIVVGDVEAGVRRDRLELGGRIARSFYPTFDGNVARESRIAGVVAYSPGRSGRTRLVLSPFAARTRTWTRDAGTSRELSAGASLHVGRQLTRELRVDAIGQAGVTPYARLAQADRVPAPAFGGQVLVALSARVTDMRLTAR